MTPPPLDLATTLASFFYTGLMLLVWLAVFPLAVMRWTTLRPRFGRAALLAAVPFVLGLPSIVIAALYLEVPVPPGLPENLRGLIRVATVVGTLGGGCLGLFGVVHGAFQIAVVEDFRPEFNAFPVLFGREKRFAGWAAGVAIGVGFAVATLAAFWGLEVKMGPAFEMILSMLPGLANINPWLGVLLAIPSLVGAAFAEEIVFRGFLLRGLARLGGDGPGAAGLAIVLTSVFFALAHVGNTDPMWPKVVQILLLGLALGVLARRTSVEASIVAHASLNVVSVLAAPLFEG